MEIWIHHKAEKYYDEIKRTHPQLAKTIRKELREIADHNDPAHYPRVKPMWGCAKGWYRLAIYQPLSVRIIFRFLIKAKTNQWFEVKLIHQITNRDGKQRILQVVKVGWRCSVYDKLDKYVRQIR